MGGGMMAAGACNIRAWNARFVLLWAAAEKVIPAMVKADSHPHP